MSSIKHIQLCSYETAAWPVYEGKWVLFKVVRLELFSLTSGNSDAPLGKTHTVPHLKGLNSGLKL